MPITFFINSKFLVYKVFVNLAIGLTITAAFISITIAVTAATTSIVFSATTALAIALTFTFATSYFRLYYIAFK